MVGFKLVVFTNNYTRDRFVYHHWDCVSLYLPLAATPLGPSRGIEEGRCEFDNLIYYFKFEKKKQKFVELI